MLIIDFSFYFWWTLVQIYRCGCSFLQHLRVFNLHRRSRCGEFLSCFLSLFVSFLLYSFRYLNNIWFHSIPLAFSCSLWTFSPSSCKFNNVYFWNISARFNLWGVPWCCSGLYNWWVTRRPSFLLILCAAGAAAASFSCMFLQHQQIRRRPLSGFKWCREQLHSGHPYCSSYSE